MVPTPLRTGKNCPCCLLIAHVEARFCEHCGHTFSTGLADVSVSETLTGAELHRTRMFTLPAFLLPADDGGFSNAARAEEQFSALTRSLRLHHRARWTTASMLLGLMALGSCLVWWLTLRL